MPRQKETDTEKHVMIPPAPGLDDLVLGPITPEPKMASEGDVILTADPKCPVCFATMKLEQRRLETWELRGAAVGASPVPVISQQKGWTITREFECGLITEHLASTGKTDVESACTNAMQVALQLREMQAKP